MLYAGRFEEAIHALHYQTPAFERTLPPAEQLWQKTLQDALRGAHCVSLEAAPGDIATGHNFTVCPDAGEAWRDPAAADAPTSCAPTLPVARWRTELDVLLGVSPVWSGCPGSRVRPVLTAHYVGEAEQGECDGRPYLLRVHHYCEEPNDAARGVNPRLAGVLQGSQVLAGSAPAPPRADSAARPRAALQPAWSRATDGGSYSTRRPFERTAPLPCQLEAFVPTPRLCTHELLGARGAARLEELLRVLFGKARSSGFVRASASAEAGGASLGKEATYGELSAEGMVTLLTAIPSSFPLDKDALLVDVGSGVGKLLLAAVLLSPAKARGIELVAQRAALAEAARADALRRGLIGEEEGARLELLHADATQPGVLEGATHVYMANLCFPEALNRAMTTALAAVASLRCVLTLRDLPLREAWPADAKACRLTRVTEVSVGMSWADNVGVSYYCCIEGAERVSGV